MMTPPEQYLLSKCSKRTRQSVKNSTSKKHNHEIWIQFQFESVYYFLKTVEKKLLIHESSWGFSPEDHRYICDLFRAPPDVYASWDGRAKHAEYCFTTCSFKRTNLVDAEWGNKLMKDFSLLHPSQDFILLHFRDIRRLEHGHTFFNARNLMFPTISGASPFHILLSFQGEHLLMGDVLIFKFFIEVYVDKWMETSNDRLKSVIFHLQSDCVISELKYEKFGGSDRKFLYDSPIKDYHKLPNEIFHCSQGYQIRRETDGKEAAIKITKDYFMFMVW